jgi:phage-related protein
MSAAPSTLVCFEKRKLIKAFEWAVSEYNRMNSAQVAALRNGEGLLFSEQIAAAGLRKDRAKYALIAHEEQHRC